GRSPAGAKKSLDSPRQAASSAHCNGPLKTRFATDSAAMFIPSRRALPEVDRSYGWAPCRRETELGSQPGGKVGSASPSPYLVSEPGHKAICQRPCRDMIHLYQRWVRPGEETAPNGPPPARSAPRSGRGRVVYRRGRPPPHCAVERFRARPTAR